MVSLASARCHAGPIPQTWGAFGRKRQQLISQPPIYGYRRPWALVRYRQDFLVNRKAVYRTLRIKRWLVHEQPWTPRSRPQPLRSRAFQNNQRWAMDVTHIPCGRDGCGHLTAVFGRHDRELINYEFALRDAPKEPSGLLKPPALRGLTSFAQQVAHRSCEVKTG